MNCEDCGGKMSKLKYLHFDELVAYSISEYVPCDIHNYKTWLLSLNEKDLILTYFRREDDSGIKEKYYLRLIEKKTNQGIKLKGLSKIFKYEVGEIVYAVKENIFSSITTYKILPINVQVDKIIRDYCENKEKFDIDNLNKIITKELGQKPIHKVTVSGETD
ncbi:MAG: hypothetical protein K0R50_4575 [Eubacterium sp.]|nr:hypothetical protein [Eubacterium sp.]